MLFVANVVVSPSAPLHFENDSDANSVKRRPKGSCFLTIMIASFVSEIFDTLTA